MLVSVACTTVISVCVLIPATAVPWNVSVLVPVLIAVTVVIPLAEKLGCKRVSLTAIPVTWSTTTAVAPDAIVDITVLVLVVSPTIIIGSLTVVCVELTVVVVPSTCKLPLMITSPSLLNPSGYGSMNIVLFAPAKEAIILFSILRFPNLELPPATIKSPPTIAFFATPIPPVNETEPSVVVVAWVSFVNWVRAPAISSLPELALSNSIVESGELVPFVPPPNPSLVSSGTITSPEPFGLNIISPSVFEDDKVLASKVKLSTFHKSTFLSLSSIATIPPSLFLVFVTPAIVPAACSIMDV